MVGDSQSRRSFRCCPALKLVNAHSPWGRQNIQVPVFKNLFPRPMIPLLKNNMMNKYLKTTHLKRVRLLAWQGHPHFPVSFYWWGRAERFSRWVCATCVSCVCVASDSSRARQLNLPGLAIQHVILEPAALSPGSLLDMNLLRSHYSLLNPYLHFNKIPSDSWKFRMYCGSPVILSLTHMSESRRQFVQIIQW